MQYVQLGPMTIKQFKAWADTLGIEVKSTLHRYLSDGERGHEVWAFYAQGWRYVCDNVHVGAKSWAEVKHAVNPLPYPDISKLDPGT